MDRARGIDLVWEEVGAIRTILRHIGKESNLLEEHEHGTVEHDPQVVFRTDGELDSLRAWLGRVPVAEIARLSGVSPRMIREIRNGGRNPSADTLAKIEWTLSKIPFSP